MSAAARQLRVLQAPAKAKYRIKLDKSYKLMEYAFDRYNMSQLIEKAPARHRVKLPHIFLAKELIRLYARRFVEWQVKTGYNEALKMADMPLLAINNEFLGDITGVTGRTIRNYRKVLERAGFLLPVGKDAAGNNEYSVFHGRACDFEVMISPAFLWVLFEQSTMRVRLDVPSYLDAMRKSFPPTSTSTVQVQQELTSTVGGKVGSEAEKSASKPPEQQEPAPVPANVTDERKEQADTPEQPERQPEQPAPRHRNEQRSQRAGENAPGEHCGIVNVSSDPDRPAKLRQQAKILLNAAKTYLYCGEVWPTAMRERVLTQIMRLYGDKESDFFFRITSNYRDRMKLAQLHWHKHHGPLPEPDDFFNPDNEAGFRLTRAWMKDPDTYPPPPRSTYRNPMRRRAEGRRGRTVSLKDLM